MGFSMILLSASLGLASSRPVVEGNFSPCCAYFFVVVKTLVVILQGRGALPLARGIFTVGVDDVAGEKLLPEGEAAGRAYSVVTCQHWPLLNCGFTGNHWH